MPKKIQDVSPEHRCFLEMATRCTTQVVIYGVASSGSEPLMRGTGFFLEHGARSFVITNTHVLEHYSVGRENGDEVSVQVWFGKRGPGSEIHGGCLVMPNDKSSVVFGVPSLYNHRDIGLVELTPEVAVLARRTRDFINFDDLRDDLPTPNSVVFYKGYPAKSAEFHGPIQEAMFGEWLDVRKVDKVSPQLIIAQPLIAVYRSAHFPEEDGKDLKGISGSALMAADDLRVVGVVWGSQNDTVDSAIYAVPAATLKELVIEYESRNPNIGAV